MTASASLAIRLTHVNKLMLDDVLKALSTNALAEWKSLPAMIESCGSKVGEIFRRKILDFVEKTGLASIRKVDSNEVEVDFDMNATLLNPRVFKGVCGTHRWKAYQKMIVPGKVNINIGDYVVVKGVTDKGKIHIIDPAHAVNDVANMPMTSFTVMADIFTSVVVLVLTPESL